MMKAILLFGILFTPSFLSAQPVYQKMVSQGGYYQSTSVAAGHDGTLVIAGLRGTCRSGWWTGLDPLGEVLWEHSEGGYMIDSKAIRCRDSSFLLVLVDRKADDFEPGYFEVYFQKRTRQGELVYASRIRIDSTLSYWIAGFSVAQIDDTLYTISLGSDVLLFDEVLQSLEYIFVLSGETSGTTALFPLSGDEFIFQSTSRGQIYRLLWYSGAFLLLDSTAFEYAILHTVQDTLVTVDDTGFRRWTRLGVLLTTDPFLIALTLLSATYDVDRYYLLTRRNFTNQQIGQVFDKDRQLLHEEACFPSMTFTHLTGAGDNMLYTGHAERRIPGQQVYCYKSEMGSVFPELPYDIGIASAHYLIVDHGTFKRGIYTVEVVNNNPVPVESFHFYTTTFGNFNCAFGYISRYIDGIEALGTVVIRDSLLHSIETLPGLSFCFYVGAPNDTLDANYADNYLCPEIEMTSSVTDNALPAIAIDVYPNPVSDRLHIEIHDPVYELHLSVSGVDGREYITNMLDPTGGNIDTSALPAGLYLYRIASATGILVEGRIVVAR
jgi:hypothetical protein